MVKILKRIPIIHRSLLSLFQKYKSKLGIFRLKQNIHKSPLNIVIGASGVVDKNWTETNIEYLNMLKSQDWERFFLTNSIDAILAEHVWEHLTLEQGSLAAKQCIKYLKRGGYLRVAVPDGYNPELAYIEHVKPGGTGWGADDHKVLYNMDTFSRLFQEAGFKVELLEYFDADGNFHFTDWDPLKGKIYRSQRFDERNINGKLNYTSLILDAWKNV